MARLRALAEDGFSAVRGYHHFLSMEKKKKNLREHLRGEEVRYKKYMPGASAKIARHTFLESDYPSS